MMVSSWFIITILSIQGGTISDLLCNNGSAVMGLAMAFSPSYTSSALSPAHVGRKIRHGRHHGRLKRILTYASNSSINGDIVESADNQHVSLDSSNDIINTPATATTIESTAEEFDAVVNARYACTRFQRYKEPDGEHDANTSDSSTNNKITSTPSPNASLSNPSIVQTAHQCMTLSQRAPTGFNAQPYRVILVHSKDEKERLAQYCLGRNADRVRDSDCTAVFLADRECGRDGKRYADFLVENMDPPTPTSVDANKDDDNSTTVATSTSKTNSSRARRPLSPQALFKIRTLILLFSSGYPLPRFLSVPLSLMIRMGVSTISFFARCLHSLKQSSSFNLLSSLLPNNIQLLPTLSSAETWSQKNTMLVAMTYILACTSRGLATCPMEGVDASGIRKVLGIPGGRFSIPMIVSVGTPHRRKEMEDEETDDVGLSHGSSTSPRYPLDEVVFSNAFGKPFLATS